MSKRYRILVGLAALAFGIGVARAQSVETLGQLAQAEKAAEVSAAAQATQATQAAQAAKAVQVAQAGAAQATDFARAEKQMANARAQLELAQAKLEEAARNIALRVGPPDAPRNQVLILGNDFAGLNAVRGTLGITIMDAPGGALIGQVVDGRAGAKAGLEVGDVVQKIDEIDLSDGKQPAKRFSDYVREIDPGTSVSLVVERSGKELELQAVAEASTLPGLPTAPSLTKLAATLPNPRGDQGLSILRTFSLAQSRWGQMELVAISKDLGRYFGTSDGLLVVHSPDDPDIGIEDGDVILTIGGRTPNSPEHAIRILGSFEAGETIQFSIMRDRQRRTIDYQVPDENP